MAEHTETPWRVEPLPPNTIGCRTIWGNKSGPHKQARWRTVVATTPGLADDDEDKANARRIVAALNACEGIPTDALESGSVARLVEAARVGLHGLEITYPGSGAAVELRAALAAFDND